jgi:hypothetical protein
MKGKAILVLAGIALVSATAAQAAKPELTGKQKKEMAASVAAHQKKAAPQPKTMAQSNAAKIRSTSGAQGQLVASDLWSTLVESDGDGTGAAPTSEGFPNE